MSVPDYFRVLWIPEGRAGTHATIAQMRRLCLQDRTAPEIVELASSFPTPILVDQLFRQVWVIVDDPEGYEYIRAPRQQARDFLSTGTLQGDCDDASTLSACLLSALGYPAIITAIRRVGEPEFSHVYTSAYEDGVRVDIDPIVPVCKMPIMDTIERMQVTL